MQRLSPNKIVSHQVDGDDMKMVESDPIDESEYDSNIIVSEVPVKTLIEDDTAEESTVRETWLNEPTKLFISLLVKLQPQLGKSYDLKNKNKMLEQIQKTLAEKGYNFSVKQVHTKYRTMERKYRVAKQRPTNTGRRRKPIKYEKELDKLFGDESVCPEYALDSEEYDQTAEGVVYTPVKRIRSETNHFKILKKLDEIGKEKAQFHANMLQRLDKKEKIEQERNELLKRIASSLENNFNSFVQTHITEE